MRRHLDTLALLARENIVAPIALIVDILGSHECPHAAVLVVLLQRLPVLRLVVIQVEQVVRCTALILLSCIELSLFYFKDLGLSLLLRLHVFEATHFALVPLLPQVGPTVLHMLVLLRANLLVSHREVLIKSLLL